MSGTSAGLRPAPRQRGVGEPILCAALAASQNWGDRASLILRPPAWQNGPIRVLCLFLSGSATSAPCAPRQRSSPPPAAETSGSVEPGTGEIERGDRLGGQTPFRNSFGRHPEFYRVGRKRDCRLGCEYWAGCQTRPREHRYALSRRITWSGEGKFSRGYEACSIGS